MSMSPGGPPANPSTSGSASASASAYGFPNPASLAGRPQFNQAFMGPGSAASSSAMDDQFNTQMRDRQARGKDPYQSGDGSDDGTLSERESGAGTKLRLGNGRVEKEDFSRLEARQKAIAFLDNPELLMMYAQSTGDSIPAARLHFTKILCGYDDEKPDHTATYPAHSRRDHRYLADKSRGGPGPRANNN
ncbi:hypothetical protein C8A00DRAFT_37224 [Chaetomidium leptoderma]|uniref:Uncharacterized protein n=1 Tax=Chaetomidium leptoderma TaxID=669021 RepID=A0AAN6ZTZ9_9PEZI|nr:hypothetical protein C8A00DRAFT_37224 [Chaetomidium leptoderma]